MWLTYSSFIGGSSEISPCDYDQLIGHLNVDHEPKSSVGPIDVGPCSPQQSGVRGDCIAHSPLAGAGEVVSLRPEWGHDGGSQRVPEGLLWLRLNVGCLISKHYHSIGANLQGKRGGGGNLVNRRVPLMRLLCDALLLQSKNRVIFFSQYPYVHNTRCRILLGDL